MRRLSTNALLNCVPMPTSSDAADQPAVSSHLAGTGAVAELERRLANHYGARFAVSMPSATTGMLALAMALGLRDEPFITTPYTYGASIGPWMLLGNRPVFADIEANTLTLDPATAHRALRPGVRAVLAVDIYGHPCDSAALRRFADEHGLFYIADAAQSLGASRDGRPASVNADAIVVSFTSGKALDVGEGGAVVTDNPELYQKLIWHSQHPLRQKRELGLHLTNQFGINGRISPVAAEMASHHFSVALQSVERQSRTGASVIGVMNESGLTVPVDLQRSRIRPAFFRIVGRWRGSPQATRLQQLMKRRFGHALRTSPAPVELIYRHAAFIAVTGWQTSLPSCPRAEQAAAAHFCLDRPPGPTEPPANPDGVVWRRTARVPTWSGVHSA